MGDWERTFGAGVSAERVIAGLNSSYFAEMREAEAAEWKRRRANLVAFRGDPTIKVELITRLRELRSRGVLTSDMVGLMGLLRDQNRGFSEFEERYRIPEPLAHVIQAIFGGLRQEGYLDKPTPKLDHEAMEWLLSCVEMIKPGTDLRYLALKVAADVAHSGLGLLTKSYKAKALREACEPALAVIYARSRGVILQNRLTEEALAPLRKIIGPAYAESCLAYDDKEDFAIAIIIAAADLFVDGAARALEFAAQSRLRVGGDALDIATWRVYSEELLSLIADAPTQRLKMIDLNEIFPLPADSVATRDYD